MPEDIKETPGQEEMPETGAELDDRQQNQLDDFLADIEGNPPETDDTNETEEETADAKSEETDFEAETESFDEEESDEEGSDDSDDSDSDEGDLDAADGEGVDSAEEGDAAVSPSDELLSLRAEIAEQQKMLARLIKKQEEVTPKQAAEADLSSIITEEEADNLLTDPHGTLTRLAERLYGKAREDIMKDIPQLVESGARRQTVLNEARAKFWEDNPQLQEASKKIPAVSRLITATANDLQAENPTWGVEQIFTETGNRVNKVLNLEKRAQAIEKEVTSGKKRSNQPGKPRGKRSAPPSKGGENRSGLQKEIDDMVKAID
jgi:hypothetical protein